jgi:hypothetical protein
MWDFWWKKWHWDRFLSELFGFPLSNIIPPLLHTHLSPPHEMCDSPDQVAHNHKLGPKLGASSLIRHVVGREERIIFKIFLLFKT